MATMKNAARVLIFPAPQNAASSSDNAAENQRGKRNRTPNSLSAQEMGAEELHAGDEQPACCNRKAPGGLDQIH